MNKSLKSRNHHILDPSIDGGKWLEANILQNRKSESLESSINTVPDVPLIPKTGWRAFPSQDLPYSTTVMFIIMPLNLCRLCKGIKMTTKRTKTGELTSRIGHKTDKPFCYGRGTWTRVLCMT